MRRHETELPCEIERILDPCIHTLSAHWAVDMRRVARKKHAPASEVIDLPVRDAECGSPARVGEAQMPEAARVDQRLTLIQRWLKAPGWRGIRRDQAIAFSRHGKEQGEAIRIHEALRLMLFGIAFDSNIREQDGFIVAAASKRHAQEMSHGAMHTVASEQVIATDLFGSRSIKPNTR